MWNGYNSRIDTYDMLMWLDKALECSTVDEWRDHLHTRGIRELDLTYDNAGPIRTITANLKFHNGSSTWRKYGSRWEFVASLEVWEGDHNRCGMDVVSTRHDMIG